MNLLMNTMTNNWDVGTFLKNANKTLGTWGSALIALIGTILVIMAIIKIFKAFSGQGQAQWGTIILMMLIGGAMIGGGWTLMTDISKGGQKTIEDLGKGSTMLFNYFFH